MIPKTKKGEGGVIKNCQLNNLCLAICLLPEMDSGNMTVDMGVMIEGVATAVVNQSHKRIRSTDDMQMKTTAVLAEQRTPIRYLVCHSAKSSCSNLHLLAAKSHPFSLKSTVLIGLISVR